ncbi:MAG: thiol peroxidase [Phycisphaerae bacterium]|nr:thiol peroxidase [Phycisphaerae bacterium]
MSDTTTRRVTMFGNPMELAGTEIRVGEAAPDFTAVGTDLKPVRLSDITAKVVVLSSVPSLDTSVCDLETRRFNQEAQKLGDDVRIVTISMDLPFAQKRWCGSAGVANVITLSDHRDASFGLNYGVLLKDLRLLARCVFVAGPARRVDYVQLVHEVTHEPDYNAVLAAVDAARRE